MGNRGVGTKKKGIRDKGRGQWGDRGYGTGIR
jgi:hypothetical protein